MSLDGELEMTHRLVTYLGELTTVVGHVNRVRPLMDYCAGLLVTEGRRNAETMAVVTKPKHVSAQHQKLMHIVAEQIALEQLRAARLADVAPGVVLMDASYGNNGILRRNITRLGLSYVAAIQTTTKVRPVREDDPKPPRVSVETLALGLPKRAWRTVAWREGTHKKLRSPGARARFAEETLLIEWLKGEAKLAKILARDRRLRHATPPARRYCLHALAHCPAGALCTRRAGVDGCQVQVPA
jgi:SRSO17 transposase